MNNTFKSKKIVISAVAAATIVLAGCGGGSGSTDVAQSKSPPSTSMSPGENKAPTQAEKAASSASASAIPVHWSPGSVNAIVTRGQTVELQVSFDAVQALDNVYLRVVPEIAPYVSVSPSALNNVKAGDRITIRVGVQAAANASLGLINGTIQVREITSKPGQGRVFPRPLPVTVLIKDEERVSAPDADNNGVWDYIDQYIAATFPNDPPTRVALRQFARATEGALLHADNKAASLQFAEAGDRAIECVFSIRPQDAAQILSELEAAILNTKLRSRAYLMFSEQSAGQVFKTAPLSEGGASCVAE